MPRLQILRRRDADIHPGAVASASLAAFTRLWEIMSHVALLADSSRPLASSRCFRCEPLQK